LEGCSELTCPSRALIVLYMKSIYAEQAEVGEAIGRIKDNQDKILDKYDPANEKLKKLMLELVQLEKELEDLDEEYEALIKTL